MKKRLLPFFLLVIIQSTYAQDSSFQLKDYKYRTQGYKALYLDLSFSGSVTDISSVDIYKRKQSYFQLYPSNLGYFHTVNTDKRIQSSVIRFSPAGGHSSLNQNDTVSKANAFLYNLYLNHNDRFYRKNKWFWEWGTNLNHSLSTNNSKTKENSFTTHSLFADNTLMLGVGKGRIESVSDAQMALYILNDLEQQGLLNNQPSPGLTRQFAELITNINNKRVLDDRRKRIYEFSQIDSFLKASGLITVNDIRYFTTLNDNWVMAFNPWRLSGANWYFNLLPGAGIEKNSYYTKNATINNSGHQELTYATLTPLIGYENYKPVNLKWQRNILARISYQKKWNSTESKNVYGGMETKQNTDSKQLKTQLYTMYGWGFFPNNRTAISASLQLEASYTKAPEATPAYKELRIINPGFTCGADYFISYRTRFTAYWNLNYTSTRAISNLGETVNGHNLFTSFSFGLVHAIL